MKHAPSPEPGSTAQLQFDDNSLLPLLFGQHDRNLARLERLLGVTLVSRGNRLAVSGPPEATRAAELALEALHTRLKKGLAVGDAEVVHSGFDEGEGHDVDSIPSRDS